jgi:hypothetical protein
MTGFLLTLPGLFPRVGKTLDVPGPKVDSVYWFSSRLLTCERMIMRRLLAFAVALAISSFYTPLVAPAGAAQAQGASLAGTATSSTGTAIANATVQLRNLATGQLVGSTTSSATGAFRFTGLSAGNYAVEVVNTTGQIIGTSASIAVAAGATITGVTVSAAAAGVGAGTSGTAAGAAAGAGGGVSTAVIIATVAAAAGVVGVVAVATLASPTQ